MKGDGEVCTLYIDNVDSEVYNFQENCKNVKRKHSQKSL